jgi:hypothetical protein
VTYSFWRVGASAPAHTRHGVQLSQQPRATVAVRCWHGGQAQTSMAVACECWHLTLSVTAPHPPLRQQVLAAVAASIHAAGRSETTAWWMPIHAFDAMAASTATRCSPPNGRPGMHMRWNGCLRACWAVAAASLRYPVLIAGLSDGNRMVALHRQGRHVACIKMGLETPDLICSVVARLAGYCLQNVACMSGLSCSSPGPDQCNTHSRATG